MTVALTLSSDPIFDTWKNREDTGCRWISSIRAADDSQDRDGLAWRDSISDRRSITIPDVAKPNRATE